MIGISGLERSFADFRQPRVGILFRCSAFSFTLEFRGTPLQECAHAFGEVRRVAGFALHLTFEVQLLFISVVGALPVQPPNQAERDGWPVRETMPVSGLAYQICIVEDAVDEAPFRALCRPATSRPTTTTPSRAPCRASAAESRSSRRRESSRCGGRPAGSTPSARTAPDCPSGQSSFRRCRCAVNRGDERNRQLANRRRNGWYCVSSTEPASLAPLGPPPPAAGWRRRRSRGPRPSAGGIAPRCFGFSTWSMPSSGQ